MRLVRAALIALLLLVAWLGAAHHRAHRAWDAPSFNAKEDTYIHRSEAAVHYRYARLIATGQGIPEIDRQLQAPEGVRPRQDFTLLMEWTLGGAQRLLGVLGLPQPPFQVTVAALIALVSALSLPLLAITTRLLHGCWRCGWAATLLYAFSVPAWVRTSGAFIREAFALPLMALVIALAIADQKRPRPWSFALLLTAAVAFLSCWHLASFIAALLAAPLLLCLAWQADPRPARRPLLALGLAVPLASLLVDALRSRGLLLSPQGLLLMGGALAAWWAPHWSWRRRRQFLLAGAGLVLVLLPVLALGGGDYAHVYQTLLSRFHPVPISELPFAARAFGSGPFAPLNLSYAIERLAVLALGAAAGWIAVVGRRPRPGWGAQGQASAWVLLVTAIFLVITTLMVRFSPILAFLAAPLSVAWLRPEVDWTRRFPALLLWVLALGLAVQTSWTWDRGRGLLGALTPAPPPPSAVAIAVGSRRFTHQWLREHAHEEAVILADFAQSPTILLATDRAVVLHSMFERETARERARLYCEGLVSTDLDAFAELCRSWSVDYLVLDINTLLDRSPDGLRQLGGSYMLRSTSVIARLLYGSQAIPWLETVYENSFTRICATQTGVHPHAPGAKFAPCPGRITFDPHWDRRLLSGIFLDEGALDRLRGELRRGTALARSAVGQAQAGDWAAVQHPLAEALRVFPCDPVLLGLEAAGRPAWTQPRDLGLEYEIP